MYLAVRHKNSSSAPSPSASPPFCSLSVISSLLTLPAFSPNTLSQHPPPPTLLSPTPPHLHSSHRKRKQNMSNRAAERRARRTALLRDFFSPGVRASAYVVDRVIGEGAYGVVVGAVNSKTGEKVAVKRIKSVLHTGAMATRILRELKFLRFLHTHENIISVKDVLIPGHRDKFNDVFVVFERMPTDLGRLLRSKTPLSEQHIKFLMFQLLRAVHFLHSATVFHRDLNPSNILVDENCRLRVCDFGLARAAFQRDHDNAFWTDYVATRWYRAPELILAYSSKYSTAIDMWSIGCIFAEMLGRGKPLFPGNNAHEQFKWILNVTGKPSPAVINRLGDQRLTEYLETLPNRPSASLSAIYRDASPPAISLLERLLAFDPDQRITAREALSLAYFDDFRSLGMGATTKPLDERQFAFERVRLSAEEMRIEFLKEIAAHHPEATDELLAGLVSGDKLQRFMLPSQAEQFRLDMDYKDIHQTNKSRTLSTEVYAVINPDQTPKPTITDYRSSTMGEAELSKYGGAPQHHASSFANHPQLQDAMDE